MIQIKSTTWDKLKEKGIDPLKLGTGMTGATVTHEAVISYLRREHGIVVDIRYSNKNIEWPPYYSLIFKTNTNTFYKRVPQKCNNYTDMAEAAIQDALNLI